MFEARIDGSCMDMHASLPRRCTRVLNAETRFAMLQHHLKSVPELCNRIATGEQEVCKITAAQREGYAEHVQQPEKEFGLPQATVASLVIMALARYGHPGKALPDTHLAVAVWQILLLPDCEMTTSRFGQTLSIDPFQLQPSFLLM